MIEWDESLCPRPEMPLSEEEKVMQKILDDIEQRGEIAAFVVFDKNQKFQLITYDNDGKVNFLSKVSDIIRCYGSDYGKSGMYAIGDIQVIK